MRKSVRFFIDESAASTTEYAIILMLVAGGLILTGDAVYYATQASLRRATAALDGSSRTTSGDSKTPSSARVGVASAPSAVSRWIPAAHLLAYGAVLAAAVVALRGRFLKRRARDLVSELDCGSGPEQAAENLAFSKRQEIQRVLLKHFDDVLHSRIEVRTVMSRRVRTVSPLAPVDALRELLEQERFHHLLVVEHGKLLGVISDRDIKGRTGRTARAIMTANPESVQPGTQISLAISMLLRGRYSCLPVVEEGEVRGILTATDLLIVLQCLMRLLEKHDAVAEPISRAVSISAASTVAAPGAGKA